MADVTVMHSVVIKATGSTAIDTGVVLELIVSPLSCAASKLSPLYSWIEEEWRPRMDSPGESMFGPNACEITAVASLLILCSTLAQHGCHVEDYELRRFGLEIRQRRNTDRLPKSPCYVDVLRGRRNIISQFQKVLERGSMCSKRHVIKKLTTNGYFQLKGKFFCFPIIYLVFKRYEIGISDAPSIIQNPNPNY